MARVSLSLLASFVVFTACASKQTAPQPAELTSEVIADDSGEMHVALEYLPKGKDIDFNVLLKGVGTSEMDKVVVEVQVKGLLVTEGQTQWSGFVAPYTKHKLAMTLRAAEGVEFASVTVTVARSVDSHVLMQTEVPFQVSAGSLIPDA